MFVELLAKMTDGELIARATARGWSLDRLYLARIRARGLLAARLRPRDAA